MKRVKESLTEQLTERRVLRDAIIFLLSGLILYVGSMQLGLLILPGGYRQEFALPILACLAILIIWVLNRRRKDAPPSIPLHLCQYIVLVFYMIFLSQFSPSIYIFWLAFLILSAVFFGKKVLAAGITLLYTATILTYFANDSWSDEIYLLTGGLVAATFASALAIAILFISKNSNLTAHLFEQTKQDKLLLQERLELTINSINEAILATDSKGKIRIFNAAAMALLDTNVNLESKKITDFVKITTEKKGHFDILEHAKKAAASWGRNDLRLVYPDGDALDLEISCSPIAGEYINAKTEKAESGGFVLMLRDITREKSLEQERNEFISVVSHELRTPAAVAEGAVSNLQFMVEKGIDLKDSKDQLETAHKQVRYLEQMINDIGTLSRADRGVGSDTTEIDVETLAKGIEAQYTAEATKKKLGFKLDLDENLGKVKTSQLYLEEILQNFITNAIKYSKTGDVIFSVKNDGDNVKFSVSDTGIGISKSDQKHIFEKFFRSEDFRTRESSGTGLGLYVTAKLARIIGAEIKVKSEIDKGSTFSFGLERIDNGEVSPL